MTTTTSPTEPIYFLRGHSSFVSDIQFTDNDHLISGDGDGIVKLWDLQTRRVKADLSKGSNAISAGIVSVNSFGNNLFSQQRTGLIKIWNMNALDSPVSQLQTNSLGFCKSVIFKHSNELLLGCANDLEKSIDIWSISDQKRTNSIPVSDESGKIGMCMSLDCWESSSGVLMFGGGFENGHIYVWDFRKLSIPFYKLPVQDQSILSFRVDGPSGKGISGSTGNNIVLFEIEYSKSEQSNKNVGIEKFKICGKEELNNGGVSECSIRNDKKIAATAGWDHRVRIFDFQHSKQLAILKGHSETVSSVKFAPSGNLIASGSKDNRIGLWKIY